MEKSDYINGILSGNRAVLSKAITLLESSRAEHKLLASEILRECFPHAGKSVRIGITGAPGVGKSSFIETYGNMLVSSGKKVAVLAIDPSSRKSGGSILGDKTRMPQLSSSENAFVRPSPSSGETGGTGTATREAIILCEAAGYEVIFVETVGVGQSETEVQSMTDFFVLITIAGAGDELQGIKRGIMEMADILIINKCDNEALKPLISELKSQLSGALHLFPLSDSGITVEVLTCSSLTGEGIEKIQKVISEYFSFVKKSGYFQQKRAGQLKSWFNQTLERSLKEKIYENKKLMERVKRQESEALKGKIIPQIAVRKILQDLKLTIQ